MGVGDASAICAIQVLLVTPAPEAHSRRAAIPQLLDTPITGQRLFATPTSPSMFSSTSVPIVRETMLQEALDAELDEFEAFLKNHFDVYPDPQANCDVVELEAQVRTQVRC